MDKFYEHADLLVLGDAVFSCDVSSKYSPTELEYKVKFLLTYNDAENDDEALALKEKYDLFMTKYHSGDEWDHKLVKKICEKSLRTFLDNTYNKTLAKKHFDMLTKSKSINRTTLLPW